MQHTTEITLYDLGHHLTDRAGLPIATLVTYPGGGAELLTWDEPGTGIASTLALTDPKVILDCARSLRRGAQDNPAHLVTLNRTDGVLSLVA